MRHEFGTSEPPPSEVNLGRGRANGPVHDHYFPPWAQLKKASEAGFAFSFQGHVKVKLALTVGVSDNHDLTVART